MKKERIAATEVELPRCIQRAQLRLLCIAIKKAPPSAPNKQRFSRMREPKRISITLPKKYRPTILNTKKLIIILLIFFQIKSQIKLHKCIKFICEKEQVNRVWQRCFCSQYQLNVKLLINVFVLINFIEQAMYTPTFAPIK